jgi:hypothetical protein
MKESNTSQWTIIHFFPSSGTPNASSITKLNWALSETGLIELMIPASVELLGESCFLQCGYLSELKFGA